MAKGSNQKLKLLYISKLLAEKTDDEHGVSTADIIAYLAENDIPADRKTIYQDLEELSRFGLDIVKNQEGRSVLYSLGSRDFELAELKLLVDSVQSAKFITERKSRALIKKLESLVSTYEAKKLHRQVIISGRVKTMNESIYYNVDKLHNAIAENVQIRFQYFQWNVRKEMELRHDGAFYVVSPWALVWDDEYYYLIGYEAATGMIKHYRVDKMLQISLTKNKREGKDKFADADLPKYSKGLFGMFGGETVRVTLRCRNDMAAAVIDRFGNEISLVPVDGEHFETSVDVIASGQFIGWVVGLGDGVQIIAPNSMVQAMRETVGRLAEQYK